jgi:lipopolysaccharide transport system ATP-binding protein
MSSDNISIRVNHLSKQYVLGGPQEPYHTFRDAIVNSLKAPLKIFHKTPPVEGFWALKDVSFEVERGEVVGIIGRNGAGKSTMLKILSRITSPTEGTIELHGRIGSLLEVGTGFHQELTGRENIYLSGSILGMKRREIDVKLDEIVKFSEIEKFLDTPVKRYSSGMYIRLAFAVAAHLDTEILLVDEVLAVGDVSFQNKCLGKMGDVVNEGRTVLFVSHNMTFINQLCDRTILLENGRLINDGDTNSVITKYLSKYSENKGEIHWTSVNEAPGDAFIRLKSIKIISNDQITGEINIGQCFDIQVEFWNLCEGLRNLVTNIYILDSKLNPVLSTASMPNANALPEKWYGCPHPKGVFRATLKMPGNFLNEGMYYINSYIITLGPLDVHVRSEQILSFSIFDTGEMREPGAGSYWAGVVRIKLPWQTEFIESMGNLG